MEYILSDKPATKPLFVLNSTNVVPTNSKAEGDEDENDDSGSGESEEEVLDSNYPELKKGGEKRVADTDKPDLKHKKKRASTQEAISPIHESIRLFIESQRDADKEFCERERERERNEEEREEKRRKEDREFLLQLARVLKD